MPRQLSLGLVWLALLVAPWAPAQGAAPEPQRVVRFFFSPEAWGGLPFAAQETQEVIARALTHGGLERLEREVLHLVTSDDGPVEVRTFTAVFEVDARTLPPTVQAGYELELRVPERPEPLLLELINADTGVTNAVEVAPEALRGGG